MKHIHYPNGKKFAFSIFDDTDVATLDSIRPLYDYLYELNILTTKTVWSLDYDDHSHYKGSHALQNAAYAEYMVELQRRGFEIGFHGATMESATRPDIERALEKYIDVIGSAPEIYAAHSHNRDNLYWGASRFSSRLLRQLYIKLSGEKADHFQGHDSESPYFWGDLAKQHLKYMRSFTFSDINLLNLKRPLVYQRDDTPWINRWFLSCDADNVEEFNALLHPKNQERLEAQGGICIISTHLGKGFVDKGEVHPTTKTLLKALSERGGWFVPVSELLDFYADHIGAPTLNNLQKFMLEAHWFVDSLRRRFDRKSYNQTEDQYLLANSDPDAA